MDLVDAARDKLNTVLAQKFQSSPVNNTNVDLEPALAAYRLECHNFISARLASPEHGIVAAQLWEMHTKVRGSFVNAIRKLQHSRHHASGYARKAYTETCKQFVTFIKTSQDGYRKLLRALFEVCPEVSVLQGIAALFMGSGNSISAQAARENQEPVSETVKMAAVTVTRDSLIYLGDLSRWRQKANVDRSKTSGWKMARSYYLLAHEVQPESGLAQHQLAVLALDDNKYFPAVSSLYQSLVSGYPHPQAASNLELLLGKRLSMPIAQLIERVKPYKHPMESVAQLRAWFLRLHARFFVGEAFDGHGEVEREVISRIATGLRKPHEVNMDTTLLQMVLINIAAEAHAVTQAKAGVRPQQNAQMYFFCFQHNVRTLETLLTVLVEALDSQARPSLEEEGPSPLQVPPIPDIGMQATRVYALWFLANHQFMQQCMDSNTPSPALAEDIRKLWRVFARCLTAIAAQYPLPEIPGVADVSELVDEEEATMGFQPIQCEATIDVWFRDGALKPIRRSERTAEEQQAHHLVRLRDIFVRGGMVGAEKSSSLVFAGDRVLFAGTPLVRKSQAVTPAAEPTVHAAAAPATATTAVELEHLFPQQLPWVPSQAIDAIWHASYESRMAWSSQPFANMPLYGDA